MAREPTTERGRVTRDRVISAATRLVRERGVAGVSLDDVEAEAAVGRSQLYYDFDDRDDLLRAVAAATADRVVAGLAGRRATWTASRGCGHRWMRGPPESRSDASRARRRPGGCPLGSLASQLAEH